MTKKIILSLAAGLALSLSAIGCGGNGGTGGNAGSGGSGGGGAGGGGGGPDMAMWACAKSPTSDPDFLNGCSAPGVDTYTISPTYPALAPGGKLPPLQ
jgi:hypothetical protein